MSSKTRLENFGVTLSDSYMTTYEQIIKLFGTLDLGYTDISAPLDQGK